MKGCFIFLKRRFILTKQPFILIKQRFIVVLFDLLTIKRLKKWMKGTKKGQISQSALVDLNLIGLLFIDYQFLCPIDVIVQDSDVVNACRIVLNVQCQGLLI
jgi:hypothetical protein